MWNVVIAEDTSALGDFSSKLRNFLMTEDKTLANLQGLCSPSVPLHKPEESVLRAMVNSYRRLRIFFDITPTPVGEKSLGYWLEQAILMVQESDVAEQEKTLRILECLRGPALEIVKSLGLSKPGATAQELMCWTVHLGL